MLEITQLQHESDHASEGLKTICGVVFLQDLFSVMRPNQLCGCKIWSACAKEGDDNTWPVGIIPFTSLEWLTVKPGSTLESY